jgi:subtilisin
MIHNYSVKAARAILSLLLCSILIFSCKKEDTKAALVEEPKEECPPQQIAGNGDVIPGQYIVLYAKGANARSTSTAGTLEFSKAVLRKHKIDETSVKNSFAGDASGFVATLSSSDVQQLMKDNAIAIIEQDRIVALSTCFKVVAPHLISWNIDMVGYGDGTGKTAWIIDSGVDLDHPDLFVDVPRSRSFVNGVTSADDENGHGTHVAGVVGAKNNTFGVLGVASGASLVSMRVLDKDGKGTVSNIIRALSHIASNGRAGDVVNMSVGGEEVSDILDQHVQAVAARGILISIAAGNNNKPANLYSPGRANGNNIYTVSAVDSLGKFASFSNYGNDVVDFAAPGVRIPSTYSEGRYARASGTSMAAPHVAGLLLLKGNNISFSGVAKNDPDGVPDKIAHK